MVGRRLCDRLKEQGMTVRILSSSHKEVQGVESFYWNPEKQEINAKALVNVDAVVHLAGANIGGKRWTMKRKRLIIDSRVKSAGLLFEALKKAGWKNGVFISASAIGYYGMLTSGHVFTENDPPAADFTGQTCRLWEQAADRFKELGARVVKIRMATVLSSKGGALPRMMPLFRSGFGSALGTGTQYMPWIHIDDLCAIYLKAINDPEMKGAYNAAAPEQPTNKAFSRSLAHALRKPFWFPAVPSFMLRLLFGQMAELLFKGSRVSAGKIMAAGFTFKVPELEKALEELMIED